MDEFGKTSLRSTGGLAFDDKRKAAFDKAAVVFSLFVNPFHKGRGNIEILSRGEHSLVWHMFQQTLLPSAYS